MKDGKLFVYEFFENGSFNYYMRWSNFGSKEVYLDWDIRFKIVLGVVEGLVYFYNWDFCIIYCDVKVSNIFLDKNFEVKVLDFGLVRLIDLVKMYVIIFIVGMKVYIVLEY